jgi:hypothetical protein
MDSPVDVFQIAGGSIQGRNHRLLGRNNQDAYYHLNTSEGFIALVCDGCGDEQCLNSEVGAKVGIQLLAEHFRCYQVIQKWFPPEYSPDTAKAIVEFDLELMRLSTLQQLSKLSWLLHQDFRKAVLHNFLFTIVGICATKTLTFAFSLGDGIAIINNEKFIEGPFPGNMPPYLSYSLLQKDSLEDVPAELKFKLLTVLPTSDLQSFLIGTDGAKDLLHLEDHRLPGKDTLVGKIEHFYNEERYFQNPFAITRKLNLINRDHHSINWEQKSSHKENGLLGDDTTLVVGRRVFTNE